MRFRLGEALSESALVVGNDAWAVVDEVAELETSGVFEEAARDWIQATVVGNHSQYQTADEVCFQHQRQTTREAGGERLRCREEFILTTTKQMNLTQLQEYENDDDDDDDEWWVLGMLRILGMPRILGMIRIMGMLDPWISFG